MKWFKEIVFSRKQEPLWTRLFSRDTIDEVIASVLKRYVIGETINRGSIVEEYSVMDIVRVEIRRIDSELYYCVYEPPIDLDRNVVEVIKTLYIENIHGICRDIECIIELLERHNPSLTDTFMSNPNTILYHYQKIESGYGPLYPLILDPYIEEASCTQEDRVVHVIHRKYSWYGWMKTNILLEPETIDQLVLALARKSGRHISYAHPIAEGLTDDGVRVALTYSREVSRKGSSFTIRKKPGTPWTITRLIDQGFLSPQIASYLWLVLELRGSILIVGGMSTGKTTLLQALLTLIPPTRKVVTIEDTPEITGSTGLWDPLVVRTMYSEKTSIDEYKLLRFALRRRADYIVVGEVRGREARLLVQASRLGHGTLATMHADSVQSAIERLVAPPISIPRNLLNNIWCIVSMDPSGSTGKRRVSCVSEFVGGNKFKKIAWYDKRENCFTPSSIEDVVDNSVRLREVLDRETLVSELSNRTMFLSKLVSKGVFSIDELSRYLNKYYGVEEVEEAILEAGVIEEE